MARKIRITLGLALLVATVSVSGAYANTTPAWRHALAVRSVGLNREYHLARFAVPATAASTAKPAWLTALEAHGRAMNYRYRLGAYASPRQHVDVRSYVAAGVGLAALLAALLAGVVLVRRTSRRVGPRATESA
jgi:ABC-type transport system involved in cytochrome c biogenesis permease subunit